MKLKLLLLLLLAFFNLFPILVAAQNIGDLYNVDYLWTQVFGLDPSWTQPRLLLFNFALPFLALMAVILGFLRELRIFTRTPAVEFIIAFVMAFSTLPSKVFILFVAGSLAFAGGFAYVVFLLLFIFGSAIFGAGFLHREWGTMSAFSSYRKDMNRIDTEINQSMAQYNNLRDQLIRSNDPNVQKKLFKLDMHIKEMQARRAALMQTYNAR
jgi:hypothetical protein